MRSSICKATSLYCTAAWACSGVGLPAMILSEASNRAAACFLRNACTTSRLSEVGRASFSSSMYFSNSSGVPFGTTSRSAGSAGFSPPGAGLPAARTSAARAVRPHVFKHKR